MANLKPVYATQSTVLSTGLNSLAAGSGANSSEQDNTANRYLDMFVDVEIAAASAATGFVTLYLLGGSATGKTATSANLANMKKIGDVQLNGTTTARAQFLVENLPSFWMLRLINNDAAVALAASGNTVKFTGINYENS
jgi:hypothetical protein